jgi:hypothetical protein
MAFDAWRPDRKSRLGALDYAVRRSTSCDSIRPCRCDASETGIHADWLAMIDPYTVGNLCDFTETITKLSAAASGRPLWFRGTSDANYELLPGLFRHPKVTDTEQLLILESRLLTLFKQRSVPFIVSQPPTDAWGFLFLMQHYGVPTRLLDWSENAFVALWFALNPIHNSSGLTTKAVWVIDPTLWNRQVLNHLRYEGGILSIGDTPLNGYLPAAAEVRDMNTMPVAMYGTHNSPRIVAQRGVFTIAGKDKRSLEAFVDDFKDASPCVWRIDIPANVTESMTAQLRSVGVSESMIFPDLEGLAREIKALEGF